MIHPHLQAGGAFIRKRIGLLGGSFNPAHNGHRAMSLYALNRLRLDEIWWLVSPQNPLKPVEGMAPLPKRLADARKLAHHPKIVVTDIERSLGTRYTFDTMRKLKRRFPYTNFVWLMGADNMEQIPKWRRWTEIFASMPVAVFRRPGYKVGRDRGQVASHFSKDWHSLSDSKKLALMEPPAWLVLDNPLNMLSATAIRERKMGASSRG